MASDATLNLIQFLLQQSDRQPIRTVNGHDLSGFADGIVRQFIRLGYLVQNEDLGDADGWIFQRDQNRIIAIEAGMGNDHCSHDALAVETYTINFMEICRALRKNSILEGPDVSILGPRTIFLGATGRGARRHEYYIIRALPPSQPQEKLLAVRAHASPECPVTIFLPTPKELPNDLMRRLHADKISLAFLSEHLTVSSTKAFILGIPGAKNSPQSTGISYRLSLDTEGKIAIFDNVELKMAPREFVVLIELANEASDLGGYVSRDRISATIRAASGNQETFEEQVDKAINRLRNAFRKDERITADDRGSLIETKPKTGYRLILPKSQIQII